MARVYNGGMKKWHRRSICIFLLAAAGTVATGLRPLLIGSSAADLTEHQGEPQFFIGLNPQDHMHLSYRWNPAANPTHTLLLGDAGVLDALDGKAEWLTDFTFEGGRVTLRSQAPDIAAKDSLTPAHCRFFLTYKGMSTLRMPSGGIHPQHHFTLAAEIRLTPCFFQKPRHLIALQELVIDPKDHAADLVRPTVPPSMAHLPVQEVLRGRETALPARFCGTVAEQEMEQLLFRLAQIAHAADVAPRMALIQSKAQELVDIHADPAQPWPQCWGSAAAKAEENAQRIIPVLQRFQEADCYGSQELADFINSPLFSRIYGG